MSKGICWLASEGIRSYSSSSVINGSGTRLTITECPDTEVATSLVLIFCASKILLMALATCGASRSEEHTSELQSHHDLVCRLLLEKKNNKLTSLYLSIKGYIQYCFG